MPWTGVFLKTDMVLDHVSKEGRLGGVQLTEEVDYKERAHSGSS